MNDYKMTKAGEALYKACFVFAKFICRHKWLYYVLNYTWGILMSLIGIVVTLVLLPFVKPEKFNLTYCFKIKKSWGGATIGAMFIRDTTSWQQLSCHEFGHTFQNCLLGPLTPILVGIPSTIRYWYRHFKYERKGVTPPTAYDDIWFERSATHIGVYANEQLKK